MRPCYCDVNRTGIVCPFELQPLQSPQYRITEIELINALGGKPALWLCIGIVIAVTFSVLRKVKKRRIFAWALGPLSYLRIV